ncbi:hypothetical protein P3T73_05425 [Kiritimatiellota bacterium B12222]|nr:hypothetical protein P3T73_05425 [Kiritimatiellota bacterium B12222]
MNLRLLLTFVVFESFVVILMERGAYFYAQEVLGFGELRNLLLALGFGIFYATGAQLSHRVTRPGRERRMLCLCLGGQVLLHSMLWLLSGELVLWGGMWGVGLLAGLKWPVVESLVSAGRSVREQAKALGAFNLAWSFPVPLSLAVTGPLLTENPLGLFMLALSLNALCIPLLCFFPQGARHLEETHPERFDEKTMPGLAALLRASRWNMLASYVMLFLLSPLLPEIFVRLNVPLKWATVCASVMDFSRVMSFALCRRWTGWHGKRWILPLTWLGIPLGLSMCLLGPHLAWVLCGEVLFGFVAGITYYAAIYYAMLLHHSSVEAGGDHEGLIGVGFALGPALGLVGLASGGGLPAVLMGALGLLAFSSWRGWRCLKT